MKRGSLFKRVLTENISYKLTAFFVTFVLWFTILGRQDFLGVKEVNLDFKLNPQHHLEEVSNRHVKFKVVGSRRSTRTFIETPDTIMIDLTAVGEGIRKVDIPQDSLDVPFGVKVLSISPSSIHVKILSNAEKAK